MFRVDYRFSGQGLWNSPALPVSLQAAIGQARARTDSVVADEVRVIRSGGQTAGALSQLVDLLV
jgi:hypothetical protein